MCHTKEIIESNRVHIRISELMRPVRQRTYIVKHFGFLLYLFTAKMKRISFVSISVQIRTEQAVVGNYTKKSPEKTN